MRTSLALLAAALLLAAAPQAFADCPAKTDFLVRSDPTLAPVRPADCSTVEQSPPEFLWPPQDGEHRYTVLLTTPGGKVESRQTSRNWLLWNRALAPGRYSWRVKVDDDERMTSEPRTFVIAKDARTFLVPEGASLLERAHAAPHPRMWAGEGRKSLARVRSTGGGGFSELLAEVDNKLPAAVQPEPTSSSIGSNYEDTVAEQKRTLAAALAWAVTRETRYGADAVRRLMAQARWNPAGTTGYKSNDMGNRTVAWTLALGYDWVHDLLSPGQREMVLQAIRARTQPMFADVVPRMGRYPYDSHGNITVSMVAAIGVLTAGDLPEADTWLAEALPLAIAITSPWGGADGAFGNGTAYMLWDDGSLLPVWYLLRNALGVDMASKEWVRKHARFMAYFVPPGSPGGLFGDGQEQDVGETWARVSKALARFTDDGFAKWYASSLRGEDGSRLELLLAPAVSLSKSSPPSGMPTAAFFPSVGWVAMHSDLADPRRLSIYFKSSPYGSYNHSHGDQNSFVIDYQGERLLMSTGYYDGYQTPHWRDWYKQTRAANAITFDGGHGQGLNGKEFGGEVVRFATTPDYDVAVGHAAKAYGDAVRVARRTMVYLKPDRLLVVDRLESATPRTWEWNLHAAREMVEVDDKAVEIRGKRSGMCVEMLASPPSAFRQTDQFAPPPSGQGLRNQWHGAFVTREPAKDADFVALFRIGHGCAGREAGAASVSGNGHDGMRVTVEGTEVLVHGDDVTVRRAREGRLAAKP